MPLAIELAAPWVQVMPCEDIAREIEGNLDLLAATLRDMPERHRSMRAVFDHSWELLPAGERRVLRQLSVFRGGFLRGAAEAVAVQLGQSPASLSMLSSLAGRSWLRATLSGRYEMHELVRQYCAGRLETEPADEGKRENEQTRDRHSCYYSGFLQEREGRLHGREQREALEEILQEMDNVWAAWHWAVDRGHVDTIGECVEALGDVSRLRGWYHEMNQALESAAATLRQRLDLTVHQGECPAREQAAVVLADVLSRQAEMCEFLGRFEPGIELARQALALLEDVGHGGARDRALFCAKVVLGGLLWISGDSDQGARLLREALALANAVGDPWRREFALLKLGTCLRNAGRYSEARDLLEQAIAVADEIDEQWVKASSLDGLSWVLWARGEHRRARGLAQESLRIRQKLGSIGQIDYSWSRLGHIATALGEYDLARQYFETGLAIARSISHSVAKTECLMGQTDLAFALGQYEEAKRLSEESHASAREAGNSVAETVSLVHRGQAAFGLGQARQARECFCQGLDAATNAGTAFGALDALLGLAYLSAEEGELETAAELLALALHHPATLQITRDRAQDLLSELETEMSPEVLAAATSRGQRRNLEEVAAEVLESNR
jgi:tetratricopeptide (TPR) repeat protein